MDRKAVVGQFRAMLRAHLEASNPRRLAYYQRIFAGFDEEIESEYERLLDESRAPPRGPDPEPDDEPREERRVGPYRLLEELGRGGQGQVFLAEDSRLEGRRVALKILGAAYRAAQVQRFQREAVAASRLDHPGICTVYEAGEAGGTHYIAMRYVEGASLAQVIAAARDRSGALPAGSASSLVGPSSRRRLFDALHAVEKAARALHEAHEAGLIHRDVKPGNIMVSRSGEPVILDFGLARDTAHNEGELTRTGELVGTPVYMSPEQLRHEPLDRRTDVYSLGATLYECLTLTRPFQAPTLDRLYLEVLHTRPPDPTRLNPRISRDVKVVLETAMEKDRARRYQTALAFAEDLRRLRTLRPVEARPIGIGLRVRRWVERNPVVAGLTIAVLLALTAGLATSLALLSRLTDEQAQTEGALLRARAVGLSRASDQALERDTGLALLLARRAAASERLPEALGAVFTALAHAREVVQYRGHTRGVRHATFSPDETLVASASLDGTIRLWKASGEPLATMRHDQDAEWVAFSPGGDALLSAGWDGTARLWNLAGEELVRFRGHERAVVRAEFSPDGTRVLTACYDGKARIFRRDGIPLREFAHDGYACARAAFSPDAGHVLTAAFDGVVRLWRADGEEPVARIPTGAGVRTIAFAPDGTSFLVVTRKPVATLHALDGSEKARFAHTRGLVDGGISPDGARVLTAGQDDVARVWTVEGEPVCVLPHPAALQSAAFAPDGRSVLTTAADNAVRIWSVPAGRLRMSLRGHANRVRSVRCAGAADRVLTAADDLTVRLWQLRVAEAPTLEHDEPVTDVAFRAAEVTTATRGPWITKWGRDGERRSRFRHGAGPLRCLDRSPDGTLLLGAGPYGRVVIWDAGGAVRRSLPWKPAHPGSNYRMVHDARFSADGARALAAMHDLHVRLFDVARGELVRAYEHGASVRCVAFLEDGKGFVSGCFDGSVLRWDFRTGARRPLNGHERSVMSLEVSGDRLLTASTDGIARIQTVDGAPVRELRHDGPVGAAALSPRGDRIATASRGTVRLWNDAGELLAAFSAHDATLLAVRFSPDGEELFTSAVDGSARLWPVYADELLRRAIARTSRDFTEAERARYAALLRD